MSQILRSLINTMSTVKNLQTKTETTDKRFRSEQ